MPQGPAGWLRNGELPRLPSARLLSACCQLVVNLSAGHRPAIAVRHSLFFAARSPGHRRPLSVACPSPAVCLRPMTVRRDDAGRLRGGVPGPSAVLCPLSSVLCPLSVRLVRLCPLPSAARRPPAVHCLPPFVARSPPGHCCPSRPPLSSAVCCPAAAGRLPFVLRRPATKKCTAGRTGRCIFYSNLRCVTPIR